MALRHFCLRNLHQENKYAQPARFDREHVTVQNTTTGQVDYLQFLGNTLTGSSLHDYGIAGWNIVGNSDILGTLHDGLVAQNPTTGFVDFLGLDANANLELTALSNVAVPHIVGQGIFNGTGPIQGIPGQAGFPSTFVSQLPNGQLDFLASNSNGQLIGSDLIPNSIGLPQAVGVAASNNGSPRPLGLSPASAPNLTSTLSRSSPTARWMPSASRVISPTGP